MSKYRKPNILILPGIREEDLESDDDIFNSKFTEGLEEIETTNVFYESLPDMFYSLEQWPESTNLHCWTCDLQFVGRPWFIPERIYDQGGKLSAIKPKGCFHSPNCAQSYIDKNYSGLEHDDKTSGLLLIYKIFTGKSIRVIKPSYPKTLMRKYIGQNGISSEEYIQKNARINRDFCINNFKVEHFKPMHHM